MFSQPVILSHQSQLGPCPSTDVQWIAVEEYRPGVFRVVSVGLLIGAEEVAIVRSYERVHAKPKTAEPCYVTPWGEPPGPDR